MDIKNRNIFLFLMSIVLFDKNYQVEEDEVGGACRRNGGEEEHVGSWYKS
jgi:hypothetical protein